MVLGGPAFVMMLKTTDFANLYHHAVCGSLDSSGSQGVLAGRQVRAPVMVIASVRRERTIRGTFAEDDDMIQTLAANGPNEPFDIGPLPRGSRTSCGTLGRPALPRCIFHVQNNRKPFRCQATTVSALTIIRADFQSAHTRCNQTQKIRSVGVNFNRLGADRRNTVSCCRRARFSSRSCAEVLNIEARAPSAVNRCGCADRRNR